MKKRPSIRPGEVPLEEFLISEGFWLGLQADYDLEEARRLIRKQLLQVEQARAEYRVARQPPIVRER